MPTFYIVADIAHYDKDTDRVAVVERYKQMTLGNFIKQTCVFRNQIYYKKTIPRLLRNQATNMTHTIIDNTMLRNCISDKWILAHHIRDFATNGHIYFPGPN